MTLTHTLSSRLNILKGIYVLIIQLSRDAAITVGKLGRSFFPAGFYAYVGSSQRDLEKRVERHVRKMKRAFWHIDYLLNHPYARVTRVFYSDAAGKRAECEVANLIRAKGETVTGFGCSDCNCNSHLFRICDWRFLSRFMQEYEKY